MLLPQTSRVVGRGRLSLFEIELNQARLCQQDVDLIEQENRRIAVRILVLVHDQNASQLNFKSALPARNRNSAKGVVIANYMPRQKTRAAS